MAEQLIPNDKKINWEARYRELVVHQFERNENRMDKINGEIIKLCTEMKLIKWKVGVAMFFLGGLATLLGQIVARKLGWL